MDFNGIKEIIDIINTSDISYFEYSTTDGHLKLDKSLNRQQNNIVTSDDVVIKSGNTINEGIKNEVIEKTKVDKVETTVKSGSDENLTVIPSPMVGTFYKASAQDKPPFVQVGDSIKSGDTLCIVEAMKLMNEIESEVTGTIVEILASDGEMVEYGQPLFKVKEK